MKKTLNWFKNTFDKPFLIVFLCFISGICIYLHLDAFYFVCDLSFNGDVVSPFGMFLAGTMFGCCSSLCIYELKFCLSEIRKISGKEPDKNITSKGEN